MNFPQAIQKLREGKKVRRSCWDKNWFYVLKNNEIYSSINQKAHTTFNAMESNDWELYPEEKEVCPKEKKEVMICAICGRVDDTHTAYCSKHGRSTHKIVEVDVLKRRIRDLTIDKELQKKILKEVKRLDKVDYTEELEKAISLTIAEKNAETKKAIEEWYNDEKTCSGKPHCLIEECDLCVNCFDELLQKLNLVEK